ncbi:MAG: class I SAM-dependent methyltransferase [Phycisphaerales bacterium]
MDHGDPSVSSEPVASIRPPLSGGPAGGAEPWTTRRLIAWMTDRFERANVEPPRLVAEMLLAHVLEVERMRLYMEPDREASEDERLTLRDLVVRAARHEPVQYLVGEAHFYGRMFAVDGSSLIPQPCTEEIVAEAVRFLRPERASVFDRFDLQRMDELVDTLQGGEPERGAGAAPAPLPVTNIGPDPDATGSAVSNDTASADESRRTDHAAFVRAAGPLVADIGTGSGCIGVSIAASVPNARVLLTDIESAALALAGRNAERFGVTERVLRLEGDGCEPLRRWLAEQIEQAGEARQADVTIEGFDAIVSNPPYIPDAEWEGGDVETSVMRHVPESATRGGSDGLSVIRPLLREAPQLLRPGGLLVIECAASHTQQVLEWANLHPRLEDARIADDEDGHPRLLIARRTGGPKPAATADETTAIATAIANASVDDRE